MLPLITEVAVAPRFSEPNRLLLDGCPKNITKLMNNFQIHNIFAYLIV
jgi:hypothetical protein